MLHIVKNQTPDCRNAIQNFIRDKNKLNVSHDYAHYDAFKEKSLLRVSLLEEQKYLCAYCMQRIYDNPLKTSIEHWKTRQDYNKEVTDCLEKQDLIGARKASEGSLDYQNLIAVCEGKTLGDPECLFHCDTKRGEKNPKLTVNPTDKRTVHLIKYAKNGTMYSEDTNIDKDLKAHLNLNHLQLIDNRSKLYKDLKQIIDIRCRGKSFEQGEILKKKIVQDFIMEKDNYPKAYIGIIYFFFKKYL
jgi:hypothetical protein